jgi:hypothetical protein
MRLWLLQRTGYTTYCEARGYVIRAKDADEARQLAFARMEDKCWKNPAFSDCAMLTDSGEPGVVLEDVYEG